MNRTSIEWTDWSVNPLKLELPDGSRVNACTKVSPGCASCYAEGLTRRWWKKAWGEFPGYAPALLRIGKPVLVEEELQAVLRLSERIAAGKADPDENKLFWNDMTDEFLEFWPDEFRDKMFAVRALTPNLIHQVLTKRADRMAQYCAFDFRYQHIHEAIKHRMGYDNPQRPAINPSDWPLPNFWAGVSVENRKHGLPRIEHLLRTPAAIRFLSVEPLLEDLGNLDFCLKIRWQCSYCKRYFAGKHQDVCVCGQAGGWSGSHAFNPAGGQTGSGIDWVIIGGESGNGARPFNFDWPRPMMQQCREAGVAVFMKQVGSKPVFFANGVEFSARETSSSVWGPIKDSKGGVMEEWPLDLRIRQMPKAGNRPR